MPYMFKKAQMLALMLIAASIQFAYRVPEKASYEHVLRVRRDYLATKPLRLTENIYITADTGFRDALLSINGCQAVWISSQGLILSNTLMAKEILKSESSPEHNYLTGGLIASEHEQEIQAQGLSCRLIESYEDVSAVVNNALTSSIDAKEGKRKQQETIDDIEQKAKASSPEFEVEVSETNAGKTFVLYRYKTIRDLRVVYVPGNDFKENNGAIASPTPSPGDFALLRAYVSPAGMPAKYAKENIPYRPKIFKQIVINADNERDPATLIDLSAIEYRTLPLQHALHQQQESLAYSSRLLDFQKNVLEEIANINPKAQLKLARRLNTVHNLHENFEQQQTVLKEITLHDQKNTLDSLLKADLARDTGLQARYGNLLGQIDNLFNAINIDLKRHLWLKNIHKSTILLSVSNHLNVFKAQIKQQSSGNKQAFFNDNIEALKRDLKNDYASFDVDADRRILRRMIGEAATFSPNQRIAAIDKIVSRTNATNESLDEFINDTFGLSKLKDQQYVLNSLLKSPISISNYNDAMLIFENNLSDQITQLSTLELQRLAVLDRYIADYEKLKSESSADRQVAEVNCRENSIYAQVFRLLNWHPLKGKLGDSLLKELRINN
ncbi:MAG: dipeptidyl-peptidase 7 [Pedobacter sp.]|nr:dipeptidyl-peptidase 7 [Pedobacter sp.]